MNKSVAEILNLRYHFEELTENFTMPEKGSHIDIIRWFIEEGHKSNSLRDGFDEAMFIAKKIQGEINGTKTIRKRL